MRSLSRSPILSNSSGILIPPELEDDPELTRAMCDAIDAVHDAMTRPLTTEEVESFAYHPGPRPYASEPVPYEPTAQDWADYRAWSDELHSYYQAVRDHHEALQIWRTFFPF